MEENKRLVVLPYYEKDIFGYHIAWETEETIKETLFWVYASVHFLPKTSEKIAQEAIDWANNHIKEKINESQQTKNDNRDGSN